MHENDSKPIEIIEFQSIQDQKESVYKDKPRSVVINPFLWIIFLILVAASVSVFFFLPKVVEKKQESAPVTFETHKQEPALSPTSQPEIEETSTLTAEELSALKMEAEKLLVQVIKKQDSLKQKSIKKWAEEEFLKAVSMGTNGDEHYRKQEFSEAIDSYKSAFSAMQQLEEQVKPTLEKHLQDGELALQQGEQKTAIFNFEMAKAIDAKNLQAINGFKRAQTITELHEVLEKGGNLEAAGRFEDAKQTYENALALDPLSTEAKNAIDRVDLRIKESEFSHLIALGYTSLDLREYEDARNAFEAAQKLFPDSEQPKQGLAKINQTIRTEKITSLKVEAEYFESNEEWNYATQSYQQILELSPNAKFAVDGFARSQQRSRILSKLDGYIENKERLNAMLVREEARLMLEEIALLQVPGSKIENKASTLEELLRLASLPVSITLLSDKQTDVVIYKVGKFGLFENKVIKLKPGKYTIVGSRPGYRDVRKVLTVSAGMASASITVRCEEPI